MNARRYASIDIGTNSTLLLVAELRDNNQLHPLVQRQATTRLGKGLTLQGNISEDTHRNNLEVLERFKYIALQEGAEEVFVCGTAAFRHAKNSGELQKEIVEKLGLSFSILSSKQEAQLTYWANRVGSGIVTEDDYLLILDIGGGSTECILGDKKGITFLQSFNCGAVYLTEKYLQHDSPVDYGVEDMLKSINSELSKIRYNKSDITNATFIGVAGTITTLAMVDLELDKYDGDKVHGHTLSYKTIQRLLEKFKNSSKDERDCIRGLTSQRADIIVAGTAILEQFMKFTQIDSIAVSEKGLRYGIILKNLGMIPNR